MGLDSGDFTALALGGTTGLSIRQNEKQQREQRRALERQERAQRAAAERADTLQRRQAQALSDEKRKRPNILSILAGLKRPTGAATLLTGPAGVDNSLLSLSGTKLLGE